MSLKIIVTDSADSVRIREGEKNGRKWRMVSQQIWVQKAGQPYPEKMEITLPNDVNPYAPGQYELDLNEYVSRGAYDAVQLDTREGIRLKPVTNTVDVTTGEIKDKPETKLFGKVA